MGSRYMVYWRVYVYANNLYSLPERETRSFRDWTPLTYRRNSDEVHRLLNFANRDLSVLLCHIQTDVLSVFDVLLELLMDVSMRSVEFSAALAAYLGPRTNHFVHELINFARSPYDDLISYDCNVQYRARPGASAACLSMPGVHSFVDFSMCVDEDECVSFAADLDLEYDDPDENDELADLGDLNAPLLLELRRLLTDRNTTGTAAAQAARLGQPASQAPNDASAQSPAVASTSNMLSSGMLANDIGLEVAIERSMLDRLGSDYFIPRRTQQMLSNASFARNLAAAAAAAATRNTDALAATTAARVAQTAAVNAGLRAALRAAPRTRSSNAATKRRRTANRDLER